MPCVLELGGKCPVVIDSTADLEFAAQKISFYSFINCGQLCIRPDFCLVKYELLQPFMDLLKA